MTQMDHARYLGPVRYLATLVGRRQRDGLAMVRAGRLPRLDPAAVLLLLNASSALR